MNSHALTSLSGWIAAVLIGADIVLPYLLRRSRLTNLLRLNPQMHSKPYLQRLWPHYWLGYLLLGISILHSFVPIDGLMSETNDTGLWLATVALVLLCIKRMVGLILKDFQTQERKVLRDWHYWMMVLVVCLVSAHIWLNG